MSWQNLLRGGGGDDVGDISKPPRRVEKERQRKEEGRAAAAAGVAHSTFLLNYDMTDAEREKERERIFCTSFLPSGFFASTAPPTESPIWGNNFSVTFSVRPTEKVHLVLMLQFLSEKAAA